MGKRKERRLAAAMNASGRRVKLDLFAEPSGDLGGSSAHDEVGGDLDPEHRAGLPNSPSSSGQQPENPLLLLGQYSDDELDEESNNRLNHAIVENSSADHNEQVNGPVGKECEDVEVDAGEDLAAQNVEQQDMERDSASLDAFQNPEDNEIKESDATVSGDLCQETDSTEPTSVPGTSDMQVVGDVNSGWKLVMHEESNQYYYWNTVTGETSWEVPDVLAQGTQLTCEQKTAPITEGRESPPVATHESNSTLDVELDDSLATHSTDDSKGGNMISETKEMYVHGPGIDEWNEGHKSEVLEDKKWGPDVNQSVLKNNSGAVSALCNETSSLENYVSSRQSGDALLGYGSSIIAGSEKYIHDIKAYEEHSTGTDLSSRLVKHSEYLLERLNSLKGSEGHLQGHNWISKYILEVEIRLSDFKSLLSYGSSLLPFWLHSERQLKRLEGAINDEVCQASKSVQMNEVEATDISFFRGKDKSLESMEEEIEADGNEKKVVFSTSENSHASSPNVDTLTVVEKDSHYETPDNDVVNAEHVSSFGYPTTHSDSGAEGNGEEVNGTALHAELTPMTGLHDGEDVDMDVDMEVEETIPASNTTIGDALGAKYFAPSEQPIQPNAPAEHLSLVMENGFGIPPPPDEEWIPPPPPDNELVPPPPPDEPPEPSYPPPPSYTETVPLSYTEQYNLSYPSSNFEFYGQTNTEVPSSNFYGHAEGCQVAVPLPQLYYESVPNIYPDAAPIIVNPVEPVAYYDLQDGTVPPLPIVSSVESSGFQSECGPVSYDTLVSDQIRPVDSHAEAGCSSLPNIKVDVSSVVGETEMAFVEAPFTSATFHAPPTISVKESFPVSSVNAVTAATAVAATSAVAKVQSKVLRSKKRTVAVAPTLRSNKKVSSLVDKWKAAKEELHEDEDDEEPENAYEILEKKRQREIEKWRAQQIASGEAKDNANFQPLGGDWRERVKRKRARSTREAVQTPPEVLTDGNQQPDLNELSRDLPTGWQAYWDESSKQVYYGNAVTAETTWTKPTK